MAQTRDGESAGYDFSYKAVGSNHVLIRRGGRIVTHLRKEAARKFLAEVDRDGDAGVQEAMARLTGNYRRGNERQAAQHPRRAERS